MLDNIRLSSDETAVIILDQTKLPGKAEELRLTTAAEMREAIMTLQVRGAPAIGIFAAYALYVLAKSIPAKADFHRTLKEIKNSLNSTRPTAVNLSHALGRMMNAAKKAGKKRESVLKALGDECRQIQHEDVAVCRSISEYALTLVKDNWGIMTYCNAGPLATSRYGTALGGIFLGHERGYRFNVYCCETRPLMQGARLTAFELSEEGINTTLICDNMASRVMSEGRVQACFVGCDRVAANGDTANKIGTSMVAVLAKHYKIPFYVFCPTSTLDLNCKSGKDIIIETRDEAEIHTGYFRERLAPENESIKIYNPSFDVTPANLITAIVTENGIIKPPFEDSFKAIIRKKR
ncbi:MAG: S-methyl-5-thioribose-1-phosphate isomerase [Oscillospiraceae bacterium]|jgi:methylthioribose-1-phosphate isomerase|nr:S-methyl-5-thioribose-1-phosphate isomerase [Oscillospiraceae bacterium]